MLGLPKFIITKIESYYKISILCYFRIYCITEKLYQHIWSFTYPSKCPNNYSHLIDKNSIIIIDRILNNNNDFYCSNHNDKKYYY